jgi:hypothetical protein
VDDDRSKRARAGATAATATDDDGAPTVRPPFDPEAFALESDTKLRTTEAPASVRPTLSPLAARARSDAHVVTAPRARVPSLEIGPDSALLDAVPALVVAREDLEWFDLSPEARKVAALVDGLKNVETLCARTSFDADRVRCLLLELAQHGVVSLR